MRALRTRSKTFIKRKHYRVVILSERSESKDLRTVDTWIFTFVRRSFDSGLRPTLRMTTLGVFHNNDIVVGTFNIWSF